jgi:hypothetical protein
MYVSVKNFLKQCLAWPLILQGELVGIRLWQADYLHPLQEKITGASSSPDWENAIDSLQNQIICYCQFNCDVSARWLFSKGVRNTFLCQRRDWIYYDVIVAFLVLWKISLPLKLLGTDWIVLSKTRVCIVWYGCGTSVRSESSEWPRPLSWRDGILLQDKKILFPWFLNIYYF